MRGIPSLREYVSFIRQFNQFMNTELSQASLIHRKELKKMSEKICMACTKKLKDKEGYVLFIPSNDEKMYVCEGCKQEVESFAFKLIPTITKR